MVDKAALADLRTACSSLLVSAEYRWAALKACVFKARGHRAGPMRQWSLAPAQRRDQLLSVPSAFVAT